MSTLSRKVSLLPGSPASSRENSGGGESSLNAPAAPAPYPYDLTWRDSFAFFCGYWAGAVSGIAATVVVGLIALVGLSFT